MKTKFNKAVEEFFLLNGFEVENEATLKNDVVEIILWGDHYSIQIKEEEAKGSMFSRDLNIYWLIGVLTYSGWMDKNYKQLL